MWIIGWCFLLNCAHHVVCMMYTSLQSTWALLALLRVNKTMFENKRVDAIHLFLFRHFVCTFQTIKEAKHRHFKDFLHAACEIEPVYWYTPPSTARYLSQIYLFLWKFAFFQKFSFVLEVKYLLLKGAKLSFGEERHVLQIFLKTAASQHTCFACSRSFWCVKMFVS